MGVNSLPKTVTRQRHGCYLNPGPTALESSTLTTQLPCHPIGSTGLYILQCRPVLHCTAIAAHASALSQHCCYAVIMAAVARTLLL